MEYVRLSKTGGNSFPIAVSISLLLIVFGVKGQNFTVRLGPVAENTITNWPVQVQPIGTNTAVIPPWLLMTRAQIDQCIASNQPAMTAWESNKAAVAQAKIDANIARIVQLFSQIPAARAQAQTLATNTGTMTTAQLTTALRQTAGVIDGILEELQRLGPVLKSIYKPEEDQ